MDIVDNIIKCHKFNNSFNQRHVSFSHNVSSFYCLQPNYINNNTKNVINTKFINCKNIYILMKCAKYKITVIPNIYWMTIPDMHELIVYLVSICDLSILQPYIKHILIDKAYLKSIDENICTNACEIGNMKFIKYLLKEINITKQDFHTNNEAFAFACARGHINVIKYLHRELGLSKSNFKSCALGWACENGHVGVIKYLHIKISKWYSYDFDDYGYRKAVLNDHKNVVKYLLEVLNIFGDKILFNWFCWM